MKELKMRAGQSNVKFVRKCGDRTVAMAFHNLSQCTEYQAENGPL